LPIAEYIGVKGREVEKSTYVDSYDEPPTQILFAINGGGTSTMNKDEVIEVTVIWDSFEESFELHSNGK
jgi:hypothetical protein